MTHDFRKHAADALKYWGYTAGDGLPPVAQAHFQSFVATLQPQQQEVGFCEAEQSDWEEILFTDGSVAMMARESLIVSMNVNKCTYDERTWICKRYLSGEFDSVSDHYLVIGRVYAYTPQKITVPGNRSRFSESPGLLDEVDCTSAYSSVGRRSINRVEWPSFKFDGDDSKSILGLRTKFPGSRFVKLRVGSKTILRGYKDIEVPADFRVEVCEEWAGKFHIVYPYGLPSFEFAGKKFEEHPWKSPSQYISEEWADGVMVLTLQEEYRTKFIPTEEVLDQGVWEAAFGIRFGTGTSGLMLVRPRPGKKAISKDQAAKVLRSVITSHDLLRHIPQDTRPIEVITEGTFVRTITVSSERVIIDAGSRPQVEEALLVRSVKLKAKQVVPDPVAQIYGSKLFLCGKHQGRLTIWMGHELNGKASKTEGKPFDLPGGTRILGESSRECLIREIREELTWDIPMQHVAYLGDSLTADRGKDTECCTSLFAIADSYAPSHLFDVLTSFSVNDLLFMASSFGGELQNVNCARWLGRFARFLMRHFLTDRALDRALANPTMITPATEYDSNQYKPWEPLVPPAVGPHIRGVPPVIEKSPLDHQPNKPAPLVRGRALAPSSAPMISPGWVPQPLPRPPVPGQPQPSLPIPATSPSPASPVHIATVITTFSGPVLAPLPPTLPVEVLGDIDYQSQFSHQNSFYFVVNELHKNPTIHTSKMYSAMTSRLHMGGARPGRVVEDLRKLGWISKQEISGGDHILSINAEYFKN